MSAQRQYFCPHCDDTFSLGRALQRHVAEEHPPGDDHCVPAGMAYLLGSAVEAADDCEGDSLWV